MIILKLMKCENATLPSPRAALKDHPKGSQNGSQNGAQKRPRNGLSGETSNAKKTHCFPYVSAQNGQWQGALKGAKKGSQKGAKKEPGMNPEMGQTLELH